MAHQINAPCTDIFQVRPTTDTVEIRMITNPEHPEYDPRVGLPLDEEMVLDLDKRGMLQPGRGYKDGKNKDGKDVVVLTVGRQRWKAINEVWRRYREEGRDLKGAPAFRLLITAVQTVAARRGEQIAENRHRQALDGLPLAQSLRAWLDLVGDDAAALEDARVTFNFKSIAALNNCLALLDTTPAVQAALLDGTLSPTAGLQLSRQSEEIQDKAVEVLRSEATGGIDSENEDPEDGSEGDDNDDEEGDERPAPRGTPEGVAPAPAKKSASVSRVKEVITDLKGGKAFEMVTLKLVEKRIEKVDADLEKAMTKLEESTSLDNSKREELAARVAKFQGWGEALRWARGETTSSGAGSETMGNDKMSAAWAALTEALVTAPWPKVLTRAAAQFPNWTGDPELASDYQRLRGEAQARQDASRRLVVAGEVVAERWIDFDGVTTTIHVVTNSKWFERLMDPFGIASRHIRDWGAHEWLKYSGKTAGIASYKRTQNGRVTIEIQKSQVAKIVAGTPIGTPYTVEEKVLDIVVDNVPKRDAVAKESRFGLPWAGEGDEEAVGPDLEDQDHHRESIADELWSAFEIDAPKEDRTWQTVGDLIAYVERKVAEGAVAAPAADLEAAPACDDQGDEAGQDGDA